MASLCAPAETEEDPLAAMLAVSAQALNRLALTFASAGVRAAITADGIITALEGSCRPDEQVVRPDEQIAVRTDVCSGKRSM